MNKGKTMNRMVLTVAVMAAALLLASGLAVVSTVGLGGWSVAQAQETAAQPPEAFQGNSAEGTAKGPGVPTSIEPARSQVPPTPPGEVPDVPLGETERGKAALERALRGDAVPAEAQKIVPAESTLSDPNQQQSSAAEPGGAPQTEAAVPTTSTFQGGTDTNWRPPDSTIAAGPDNLVVATNGAVNVRSKDGTLLQSSTLEDFFSPLGPEHYEDPANTFDP
jgi:hypothetical protein